MKVWFLFISPLLVLFHVREGGAVIVGKAANFLASRDEKKHDQAPIGTIPGATTAAANPVATAESIAQQANMDANLVATVANSPVQPSNSVMGVGQQQIPPVSRILFVLFIPLKMNTVKFKLINDSIQSTQFNKKF